MPLRRCGTRLIALGFYEASATRIIAVDATVKVFIGRWLVFLGAPLTGLRVDKEFVGMVLRLGGMSPLIRGDGSVLGLLVRGHN